MVPCSSSIDRVGELHGTFTQLADGVRSYLESLQSRINEADWVLIEQQRVNRSPALLDLSVRLKVIEMALQVGLPKSKVVVLSPAVVKTAMGLSKRDYNLNKQASNEYVKGWQLPEAFWNGLPPSERHHNAEALIQAKYFLETKFSKPVVIKTSLITHGEQTETQGIDAQPNQTPSQTPPIRTRNPRKRSQSQHQSSRKNRNARPSSPYPRRHIQTLLQG